MSAQIFDDRPCELGEGPLWHPLRQQLFWFDILGKRLLSQKDGEQLSWSFDEHVSAAGWVDIDTLLIASETALFTFDLTTGAQKPVCGLEADNAMTRSNDGRADPFGGFWIGTMGKASEPRAGAIYRLYKGELRCIISDVTISNSICFAPDGSRAYFTDTVTKQIMSVALDNNNGWLAGEPEVFIDLAAEGLNPDGSVVDAQGNLWNAQWGAHRVACYASDGTFVKAVEFPAEQVSCPAFGGKDLNMLLATTAAVGLTGAKEGLTFAITLAGVTGQLEHQVILD